MAKQIIETLIDDIDGTDAAETVTFGLDGVLFEIDLSEKNGAKLRDALSRYIANGTKLGRTDRPKWAKPSTGARRDTGRDTRAIREWANANGYSVPTRGRIPGDIEAAYLAAQSAPADTAQPAKVATRRRGTVTA